MYLLIALILILGKYIPDALYDSGKKTLAGNIRWVYMFATAVIVFAYFDFAYPDWLEMRTFGFTKLIIGFCLLWYAIGDLTYNLMRKLPVFYLGTTKQPDKLMKRFLDWSKFPDDAFLFMTKLIALIWGVAWLLIQNP
jgi:hypothetical protein